jgi:hypothetical protein
MRRLVIAMAVACAFVGNTFATTAQAPSKHSTTKKSTSHHASKSVKRAAKQDAHEIDSEKTALKITPEMVKKNPHLAGLVGRDADEDIKPTDQPAEAMSAYVEARLPKGEKMIPTDRYFTAKDKIKRMKRYSSRKKAALPSVMQSASANSGWGDPLLPGFTGDGHGTGDGSAATSGTLGTWQALGPGNVGGRTRAILIDPSNPNTMYAAGVAGGVWKSTDAGTNWTAVSDFLANIAVTCMAFDPSNSSIIYAGTGEGFFNADAVQGAGIFKSTDAGLTWNRLASTAPSTSTRFLFVNDIVVSNVDPQHIYAATRVGVMRSLDGGATWAMILNVPTLVGSVTGVRGAMDLALRTDKTTDWLYVGAGTAFNPGEPASHIFRSTDAANAATVSTTAALTAADYGSFTDVYSEADMGRTSLAISPSNQDVIYAVADTSNATGNLGLLAVFRSTSSGDALSWTTQVRNNSVNKQDTLLFHNPVNAVLVECGFGATNNPITQGWYDNVIAVDPTDSNIVWVGGTDLFRSDNAGVNWGVASYWWFQGNGTPPNNGDPQLVHADNHALVFAPGYNGTTNQTLYAGDDGGIYKTDNAKVGNVGYVNGITPSGGTVTATSPICGNEFTPGGFYTVPSPVIWGPLNNGYAVTQFWPGTVYPNGTTYMGGTQDNGTNRGTDANGPNQWERINGGDGGFTAVKTSNTNVLYAETTGNSFSKSTNGGASFAAARTGISGDTFPFTAVFRMDPNNDARLWYAGRFMWRTSNDAGNWTRTSDAQQTGGNISAIAIQPGNSDKVIDGAASGQIRRTAVGTTATSVSALNTTWLQSFTPRGNGFGSISWVEYDPNNIANATDIVWATVSNFNSASSGNGFGHVFRSTDGGANWTLRDGNQSAGNVNAIPDIPVHCVAIDPNDSTHVYVGTDLGVFISIDSGANWYRETTGFSNAVVKSITAKNLGGVTTLYAFTHGRGAFKVSVPLSCASVTPGVSVNAAAGGSSASVTLNGGVTAPCTWNAVSNDTWLHVTAGSTSGSGNGTVNFTVDQNTGAQRAGTLTVAGQTVTITQYSAPDAVDDSTNVANGGSVIVSVLANDTDAYGSLSVTSKTDGTNGTVAINGDNTVTYTTTGNYIGSDSFTYTVTNTHGDTDTATVNVTIDAAAPNANDDTATTTQDIAVIVNVVSNDNDPNGASFSVTGVTNGAHGTVLNNGDGTVTYTPAGGYNGSDSFTYTITNSPYGLTDTATVNVTIGKLDQNANGSGYVADAGTSDLKGTFSFTLNRKPNGTPNGSVVFTYKGTDGFNYAVNSSSLTTLVFPPGPGSTVARVSVVGKCIVQKINRTTGAIVQSLPNYNFTMDSVDGDKLTPKTKDQFTITVTDTGNGPYHTTGPVPVNLGSGTVTVKSVVVAPPPPS